MNSDDPAYFGGYLLENYRAIQAVLGLTRDDVLRLARNAIEASFLDGPARQALVTDLDARARIS